MTTLHLNLALDATRRSILANLRELLDAEARDALDFAVEAAGVPERHHHDLGEVFDTIDRLAVSDQVKDDLYAIYSILAQAEAAAHGCTVEETHFHEVGNGEAIRNVCAVSLAIEALDPDCITATRVQTGSGKVQCAHGELDIPAPATAAILATGIPVCEGTLEGELCTPTSAALIKHFVDDFIL